MSAGAGPLFDEVSAFMLDDGPVPDFILRTVLAQDAAVWSDDDGTLAGNDH